MEQLYTKKDVAARYGFSLRTIDEWIASERIGYLKINRSVRFSERHLRDFEKAHNIKSISDK